MEKLNEYLQTLLSSCSYELHLEPNKTPYVVSDGGTRNVANAPLLGTQISMLVFPLIPLAVKRELPNKTEVEFVHNHNLGNFNFHVRKSPAGFNVTIRPLLSEAGEQPDFPLIEANSLPQMRDADVSPNAEVALLGFESFAPAISSFSGAANQESVSPAADTPDFFLDEISLLAEIENSAESDLSLPEVTEKQTDFEPEDLPSVQPKAEIVPIYAADFIERVSDVPNRNSSSESRKIVSESVPQAQIFPPNQPIEQVETLAAIQTSEPIQTTAPDDENPSIRGRMDALFYKMAEVGASDLHLSVSVPPLVRKDGKMQKLEEDGGEPALLPETIKELLTSIMPAKNREEFNQKHDTDFAYEIENLARFRANVFMDRKGMGAVFRLIPSKITTAEELGLSEAILNLCELSKGLILVTGPTGSGKSTTLRALVNHINLNREDHIITIEDPIEFTHENRKCLVNQREVGNHTDSFKDALRAARREDPDVLLVGEMRDLETISIAIETAETGHLVFGTLHTTTAASTVDRIIDQFPADRQQQIRVMLSESLKGVVAQTLLPKKGGGRVAALEVLIVTPAISNLIREGKTFQIPSAMQAGKARGMIMLDDALFDLVKKGLVEPRAAYVKAVDKRSFEALLTGNGMKI